MSQNGCIRVLSGASYRNPIPVHAVVDRLRSAARHPQDEFRTDDVSLLDANCIDETRVHGPAQLTDIYLLALAVFRGGRLVTLDRRISTSAVIGARPEHLVAI